MQILVSVSLLFTVAALGYLGYFFATDAKEALNRSGHATADLPKVMSNRYVAFCLLGLGLLILGNLPMIALFFAVCAMMGFWDAAIYRKSDASPATHLKAGFLAVVAFALTLVALVSPAFAGVDPAKKAKVVSVLEKHNCRMHNITPRPNVVEELFATGLTRDDLKPIAAEMFERGETVKKGEYFVIKLGKCK